MRDMTEQQGTRSGPEWGPQFSVTVAHDITEGNHWYQLCQWDRQKQPIGEAS